MTSIKNVLNMNMAKNIYLSLTGAGVIVFMIYSMRIGFLPTGLSLSDVIFFLLVTLSFSIFLTFYLTLWYSMSVVISYFCIKCILLLIPNKKIKREEWRRRLIATLISGKRMKIYVVLFAHSIIAFIGGFILLLNIYNGVLDVKFVLASLALTSMFIPLIAYTYVDKKIKKEDKRITAISIWVLIIVIFFTVSNMAPVLNDAGMKLIGVRKTNVAILLKGNELEMAKHLTGNQDQTLFKGDALFTGVGTSSLLVINNKKIIVKNENLTLSFSSQ
ncbi:TPA: hypothetical protein IBV03_000231 [Escherichia coli]|uniref:hypothetical protein n=1 Tax=Escherichia coli TaxID=562 RepID=UPI0019BE1791|nr:hypothetical protein [Escherichia coli]HAM3898319.1 hypothetical protein [Escherichia coli]